MAKKAKAAKRSKAKRQSARGYLSIATSARNSVKQRVAAIAQAPLVGTDNDKGVKALLNVLGNKSEPIQVRLAALQSLGAAAFSVIAFESSRGDYLATLRKVADDPDPELRQRVLGLLMREKDGFAQKKLLDGLKRPANALLPPEKALQLLSYDPHGEAYAAARAVVKKPPNDGARREALRLLAADAKSAPLFEKVFRDKNELRENRQIAASALHALDPAKFQANARQILLDKSDYADIKATSVTALTSFGDDTLSKDTALLKSVGRLSGGKTPAKYKQSARQFLRKYGE